jgi:hypothetical protein
MALTFLVSHLYLLDIEIHMQVISLDLVLIVSLQCQI